MSGAPRRVCVRLLLTPVVHALPALQAYFEAQTDDESPLTTDQTQTLAHFVTRVLETSELVVRYAVALSGNPVTN